MIELLNTRNYKAGYIVNTLRLSGDDAYGSPPFEMKEARTPSGDYIGGSKDAYYLCKKKGIAPQKRAPSSGVCSIGFCEDEQKWYGWSHRAIFGFGVGSAVSKGDCIAGAFPIGFKAKSLADAKRMAEEFAESVS